MSHGAARRRKNISVRSCGAESRHINTPHSVFSPAFVPRRDSLRPSLIGSDVDLKEGRGEEWRGEE